MTFGPYILIVIELFKNHYSDTLVALRPSKVTEKRMCSSPLYLSYLYLLPSFMHLTENHSVTGEQ
jgi:hypothetical protein